MKWTWILSGASVAKHSRRVLVGSAILLVSGAAGVHGQVPSIPKVDFTRYLLHEEVGETLRAWHEAFPNLTRIHKVGSSYQGKDLWVLEITNFDTGPGEEKPAFWADGGTHPDEPVGTPMVLHTAQVLLLGFGNDPFITDLVDTRAFYIMPKVNPDAVDYYLTQPGMISHAMPWDDDRDGLVDEDPPEDLNGDGAITVMRVRDESGPMKVSPLDPRLVTTREEWERGEFRLMGEGLDNDGDGRFNEDDVGGINVNRTYPYEWDPAQRGSGPYPLAIPESRAVVDFFARHPNITGAYSIHGGGWATNWVVRPPANVPDDALPDFDVDVLQMMGARYSAITGGEQVVSLWGDTIMKRRVGPYGWGLFVSWAYHQYGVFAFTPEMSGIDADYDGDGRVSETEMLRWQDTEKGGRYYVDWTPFDHPQLGPVEVGGWVKKVAPIDSGLEKICRQHTEFMLYQASLSPLLRLSDVSHLAIADDVYKVTAEVSNYGFLPTFVSETARGNQRDMPVILSIDVANGEIVSGHGRSELGHLLGNAPGEDGYFLFSENDRQLPSKTVEWVIKKDGSGRPCTVRIQVAAAKAGRDERMLSF
jgi:hypothetical protein